MADKSKIEWTDATWNPIRGTRGRWHCTKVSSGCAHCYAEAMNRRFGGPAYTRGADTLRLDLAELMRPSRWRKPRQVFVCSMTDLFHEDVRDGWLDQIFAVMALSPEHTFQVLTKRAERMHDYCRRFPWFAKRARFCEGRRVVAEGTISTSILPNVWLGVSVEDQQRADERIPLLLETPAAVRFLSCEPLLGPVDLDEWLWPYGNLGGEQPLDLPTERLHWVIAGGESGAKARPSHPDWFRSLRDQCAAAGVAFFFKQWGAWVPTTAPCRGAQVIPPVPVGELPMKDRFADSRRGDVLMRRVGKKAAGRLLDGVVHDAMPEAAVTSCER